MFHVKHNMRYSLAELSLAGGVSGALRLSGAAGLVDEAETLLGARFDPALGRPGARSAYVDVAADWAFADGWRLGLDMRRMWTDAEATGGFTGAGALRSEAWTVDLARDGAFAANDRLALRIAQPLRVSGGGVGLLLAREIDADSGEALMAERRLSLIPSGREIVAEASWQARLGPGWLGVNGFWRHEPGHRAGHRDDMGMALRYSGRF